MVATPLLGEFGYLAGKVEEVGVELPTKVPFAWNFICPLH